MTSLERILASLSGSEADRQSFTLLLSLYGAALINADAGEYYRDPALWFRGQQEAIKLFDPDILLSPFSFPLESAAFGSELVYFRDSEPNIKKPFVSNFSQIDQIKIPEMAASVPVQYFMKATDLLVQNYKGYKAIASPLQSPADMPNLLMGTEMWIDTLLFHPAEVEKIMKKTMAHFIRMGNEYLARGVTFLVVPVNFTNPMMITEKIFANLIPFIELAFSQIKGPIVIHNGGCKIMSFIDRFAKLPNVIAQVLEPGERFEEARQIIGDQMVLLGNLDGPDLANWSTEKAVEKTLKILNNRKHDRHFIFASSNADISYNTPVETIMAVVETIRNFKKY